jgi:hypothetical protein
MDETHTQTQPSTTSEPGKQMSPNHNESSVPKKNNSFGTLVVIGAVVVALGAVAMLTLGKTEAPASSNGIDPEAVVARVNGEDIVGADLTTSISQIVATAQLQGIDTTDPAVQSDIQDQAVEMLVNTALLEAEAENRGIIITDEQVEARITALVDEVGSQDLLDERMVALGISEGTLREDVRSELMIQELLDQVFAEAEVTVTEEEITSLYETSVVGAEDAPPLEEVRDQVEAQLQNSKEQQIVNEFISTLRSDAEIEIAS